ARKHLLEWHVGIARLVWFIYASPPAGSTAQGTLFGLGANALSKAGIAYNEIYDWMVGSVPQNPFCMQAGTLWTCDLTLADGTSAEAIWDTSKTCSAGSCAISIQTVANQWIQYRDLEGNRAAVVSH